MEVVPDVGVSCARVKVASACSITLRRPIAAFRHSSVGDTDVGMFLLQSPGRPFWHMFETLNSKRVDESASVG